MHRRFGTPTRMMGLWDPHMLYSSPTATGHQSLKWARSRHPTPQSPKSSCQVQQQPRQQWIQQQQTHPLKFLHTVFSRLTPKRQTADALRVHKRESRLGRSGDGGSIDKLIQPPINSIPPEPRPNSCKVLCYSVDSAGMIFLGLVQQRKRRTFSEHTLCQSSCPPSLLPHSTSLSASLSSSITFVF